MMKYIPQNKGLQNFIDYYWVVDQGGALFQSQDSIYAYPGITPELILILDGALSFNYQNRKHVTKKSTLFGFIQNELSFDPTRIHSFIVVKFKSRGLSSLLPFITWNANDIMKKPIVAAEEVFSCDMEGLVYSLKCLPSSDRVALLDEWFMSKIKEKQIGFLAEMAEDLGDNFSVKTVMDKTGFGYSTLERYFKKETGLTPKRYHSLYRYKQAVQEIYTTRNSDWIHYVEKYGYYDQSHFIKEIKKYTSLTPTALLNVSGLVSFRT